MGIRVTDNHDKTVLNRFGVVDTRLSEDCELKLMEFAVMHRRGLGEVPAYTRV